MGVHDWTRAPAGVFHDFHGRWITRLTEALNDGLLSADYVARSEQWYDRRHMDVLTLRGGPRADGPAPPLPPGSVAIAEAPPPVRLDKVLRPGTRRRSVVVRRVGDEEVVAVIEVVSPANKDRADSVAGFVGKVTALLRSGVHVVVLDLLPPGRHVPAGLHAAISDAVAGEADEEDLQPADASAAFLSYAARPDDVRAFVEFLRVGDPLPPMPLCLSPDHYIRLPLATTYDETYRRLGAIDRRRLEAPPG
jgi:hypothetical protein